MPGSAVSSHSGAWTVLAWPDSRPVRPTRRIRAAPARRRGWWQLKPRQGAERPASVRQGHRHGRATFRRMPAGLDPVFLEDIDFIERWIDDGCPDAAPTVSEVKVSLTTGRLPAKSTGPCRLLPRPR